jgi:parallel beta-helix repeat protein
MRSAIYRLASLVLMLALINGGTTGAVAQGNSATVIVSYFDDRAPEWKYLGGWKIGASTLAYKGGSHLSTKIGDSASILMLGSSFSLMYTRGLNKGRISIYVDNVKLATVDQGYIQTVYKAVWNSPLLNAGRHVVRVVHATGNLVDVDAIKVNRVASSYFVDAAAGSDGNPGSQAQPWRTIQRAANSLVSGDSVTVQPGDYPELVEVNRSGNSFIANGRVTMRGFYVLGSANLVRGFVITNPESEYGIRVEGSNNVIQGNDISDTNQDGIWFFGNGNRITGNRIHDIVSPANAVNDPHTDCFQTWGPAENIIIEKNVCNHTRTSGTNQIGQISSVKTPVRNLIFRNNVFIMHDSGFSPLNFNRHPGEYPITNIFVVNNTFVHMGTGSSAIRFSNVTGAYAINNLIVNFGYGDQPYVLTENGTTLIYINHNAVSKADQIRPKRGIRTGDLWLASPKFVDARNLDFHLQALSAAINKGAGLTVKVTDDFDSTARPQGSGYDIGAFEYKP